MEKKNPQIPKSHMLYQLSLPGAPQLLTVLVSVHVSEKTAMAEKARNTVQGSHVTDSVGNGEPTKAHELSKEYMRFTPQ